MQFLSVHVAETDALGVLKFAIGDVILLAMFEREVPLDGDGARSR